MPNATQLLRQDHKKVEGLFSKCEQAKGMDAKRRFAMQVMNELDVHAQLEEEIFYPALRAAFKETDLIAEAEVEHQSAKDLIAQIEAATDIDETYDAKVKVLGEYVKHHVKEEEQEIFPKARRRRINLQRLGNRLMARKIELGA